MCVFFFVVFERHLLRCELKYGFRPRLLLSNCQNHHKARQLKARQVQATFAVLTLVPKRKCQSRFRADWNQQSLCCLLLSSSPLRVYSTWLLGDIEIIRLQPWVRLVKKNSLVFAQFASIIMVLNGATTECTQQYNHSTYSTRYVQ